MNIEQVRADFLALHNICRYNGRVKRFFSVAEHTAIGLEVMERDNQPDRLMRAFLVHDLPEAALGLGDLSRDVKREPDVAAVVRPREAAYLRRVADLLDICPETVEGPIVKAYDRLMSVAEVQAVAMVPHDDPEDFQPAIHGYACRRILENDRPRLDGWAWRLLGIRL